jgi:hypothetical protein
MMIVLNKGFSRKDKKTLQTAGSPCLILLFVVIGVVDAFHEDLAVVDPVGQGPLEQLADAAAVNFS